MRKWSAISEGGGGRIPPAPMAITRRWADDAVGAPDPEQRDPRRAVERLAVAAETSASRPAPTQMLPRVSRSSAKPAVLKSSASQHQLAAVSSSRCRSSRTGPDIRRAVGRTRPVRPRHRLRFSKTLSVRDAASRQLAVSARGAPNGNCGARSRRRPDHPKLGFEACRAIAAVISAASPRGAVWRNWSAAARPTLRTRPVRMISTEDG